MKKAVLKSIDKFHSYRDSVYNKIQSPVIVLMYHRVLSENKENNSLTVSSKNFQDQMNYLKENFNILRFDSDWQKSNSPSFVITFDDGYYDNYLIARDFLAKESIASTFFITTKNIGTNDLFWWDEIHINRDIYEHNCDLTHAEITRKLIRSTPEQQVKFLSKYRPYYKNENQGDHENYRSMSKRELHELSQFEGVCIGAHTINHTRLSLLNEKEISLELSESKRMIEEIIKKEVVTASFPYGSYNQNTIKVSKKLGLTKTATTVAKNCYSWTNPMMIPRVQVMDDSIDIFKEKINKLIN